MNVEWKYAFEQNKPALFESKTLSYHLFSINTGTSFTLGKVRTNLIAGVSNLFDKTYTDHLSSLKPLGFYNPGRSINVKLAFKL